MCIQKGLLNKYFCNVFLWREKIAIWNFLGGRGISLGISLSKTLVLIHLNLIAIGRVTRV